MAERIPGIIVRIVDDAGLVAPPAVQRFPCIIGKGDPYKLIQNVRVVRSLGSVDDIPCITTINDITQVGDLPGIAGYTDTIDYQLVAGQNKISWLPGGDAPAVGDSFYVTYTQTRPASAYQPTLYFDENLVYEDHGGITRTNATMNDVSKGANLAFANGSKGVVVLQLDDRSFADPYSPTNSELEVAFQDATTLLNTVTDWKLLLVGMSSGTLNTTTAGNILFSHAVLCSQPERKQERTVFMAMPQNSTLSDYASMANAYHHERMVIPAVPSAVYLIGDASRTAYDTRFYVAALAGKYCSGAVGAQYSDETIAGVTFDDNFTYDELNYLVQEGVSPSKSRSGVVRNVLGITTDTTNALTEDLGVSDVKDYVKKFWREALWDLYKNKPITTLLPLQMVGTSQNMLNSLIRDNIITQWRNVTATQDPGEPRKINMTGQIMPIFTTQWVDITFTFVQSFSS